MKRNKIGVIPDYKFQQGEEKSVLSSNDWRTPLSLFQKFDAEFNYTYDYAADDDNHLCMSYYTKEHDALTHTWMYPGYANIPYSAPKFWYEKARLSAIENGALTTLLVKVATSEKYWFENVGDAHVRYLAGRIKFWDQFNKPHYGATFGNALLIFSPETIGNHKTEYWDYRPDVPVKVF